MPAGQLLVQPLYGTLSADGFVLEQVYGITHEDQVLSSLTGHGLPMFVVVSAGTQHLENQHKILLSTGDAVVLAGDSVAQWRWTALGEQRHRLIAIKWSAAAYERIALYSQAPRRGGSGPQIFTASPALQALAQSLASPPTHLACLPVWYQAKVMEVAALALYEPPFLSTESQAETTNRDRAERAMFLLERDLRNPPTLEMLARELGCGAFQLSRLFKEHAGMTIPEFLRKKRMDLAAQALTNTRLTVSDVVLEVGYESFSAFTRAFVREFKVTPSEYRQRINEKRGKGGASAG